MNATTLSYNSPAPRWIDGMPLGNGRLGAMVQGQLYSEQIALNDDTVWSASAGNRNNPDCFAHLQELRELLLAGDGGKALLLADAAMMGTPSKQAHYQPLASLNMEFSYSPQQGCDAAKTYQAQRVQAATQGVNLAAAPPALTYDAGSYRRTLDIAQAVAQVSFDYQGARYQREYFTSAADAVLVAHFTADAPAAQTCSIGLYRHFDVVCNTEGNEITLLGQAGKDGVCFCTKLSVCVTGAQASVQVIGEKLFVEQADSITLRLVNETDYRTAEYQTVAAQLLAAANQKDLQTLKERHIAEYTHYFNRMTFSIASAADESALQALPIDQRLRRVQEGEEDINLAQIYFAFGRYLLISASRPGSMAANLQGIWCNEMVPTWDSKYTININTQMNYWPAEVCNLSDCHQPLLTMVANLRENGRRTAREMYHCGGFVVHHNTDLWLDTAPLDYIWSGVWPMGGVWLSLHLWEHFIYTDDMAFLQETAYPTLREAAEFFLDYLFEVNGVLMTGPSLSPENIFLTPNGEKCGLCCAPAMDTQLLTALFQRCLDAAALLHLQDDFTAQVRVALAKLPPMKINAEGLLQEWFEDYPEFEPHHRHLSHLFAVYPERQMTAQDTPALFAAARKSLEKRIAFGGGGTGWSLAWIIALWARFGEGDNAWQTIQQMLAVSTMPSLLDIHPPCIFQIDGNLGTLAGMTELLLQTGTQGLSLMPALPSKWASGKVTGLCAPHGLVIDLTWQGKQVTAVLHAKRNIATTVLLGTSGKATAIMLPAGQSQTITFALT